MRLYIHWSIRKNIKGFEAQEVLENAHGVIEECDNCPHDFENECYDEFAKGYVNVNTKKVVENDDIENCTTHFSNPNEEELSDRKIIVLENRLEKMRKRTQSCVMRYHKVSDLEEPELHYMKLL